MFEFACMMVDSYLQIYGYLNMYFRVLFEVNLVAIVYGS